MPNFPDKARQTPVFWVVFPKRAVEKPVESGDNLGSFSVNIAELWKNYVYQSQFF